MSAILKELVSPALLVPMEPTQNGLNITNMPSISPLHEWMSMLDTAQGQHGNTQCSHCNLITKPLRASHLQLYCHM